MDHCPYMKPHEFNLRVELFWFGSLRLLLLLIQLIPFLNAFEMASFIWSLKLYFWNEKDNSAISYVWSWPFTCSIICTSCSPAQTVFATPDYEEAVNRAVDQRMANIQASLQEMQSTLKSIVHSINVSSQPSRSTRDSDSAPCEN